MLGPRADEQQPAPTTAAAPEWCRSPTAPAIGRRRGPPGRSFQGKTVATAEVSAARGAPESRAISAVEVGWSRASAVAGRAAPGWWRRRPIALRLVAERPKSVLSGRTPAALRA